MQLVVHEFVDFEERKQDYEGEIPGSSRTG
jgi:hypothetical protein